MCNICLSSTTYVNSRVFPNSRIKYLTGKIMLWLSEIALFSVFPNHANTVAYENTKQLFLSLINLAFTPNLRYT